MTAEQFTEWMRYMGMTREAAGKALGICRRSVYNYERGIRQIPKSIDLACDALADKVPKRKYRKR